MRLIFLMRLISCLIVLLMWRIRAHYLRIADQLRVQKPRLRIEPTIRVYVLVSQTWPATNRAIQYAELLNPAEVKCVHVRARAENGFELDWGSLYPDYPLTVIEPRNGGLLRPLRAYLRDERRTSPAGFMTVVVPEKATSRHWWQVILHRHAFLLKAGLLFERGLTVTDLVYVPGRIRTKDEPPVPAIGRRIAVVPIDDVTQPALRAVAYAEATQPAELHVVHADVDADHTAALRAQWEEKRPDLPLEILPSPYRESLGLM